MINHAAGAWIKYDNQINLVPSHGQWCLWSMVISGHRNYFAGSSFPHHGKPHILFTPYTVVEINDTCYYALVSHIKETSPPNPGDGSI